MNARVADLLAWRGDNWNTGADLPGLLRHGFVGVVGAVRRLPKLKLPVSEHVRLFEIINMPIIDIYYILKLRWWPSFRQHLSGSRLRKLASRFHISRQLFI